MITEIRMDAVASYKHTTSLVTNKKINLIETQTVWMGNYGVLDVLKAELAEK